MASTNPLMKGRGTVFDFHPVRSLILLICLIPVGAGTAVADDDKESLATLRAEADRCLKLKKSRARQRLCIPLLCAERLRQTGDTKAARRILSRIVKIDPWAMEAHLMLTEMQKEGGEKEAAEKKARWILEHAETGSVRSGALHLLDQPSDTSIPNMERVPGTSVTIVLIPIGTVDALLLKAAARKVMRHINFPVLIQQAGLHLPPGGDNPLQSWTEQLRASFDRVVATPEGQAALSETGRSRRDLSADDVFFQVYRTWLEQTARWRDLSDFEARIRGAAPRVWHGDEMNRHLATVLGPYGSETTMYVGVTRGHMLGRGWRGNERPAFGWGGKGVGSVSYGPYFASRSGEKPNWDRLLTRVAKQIICVAGSTLQLSRCTKRKCPMRVVVDLRSLDAKGLDPCKTCAQEIRERY